MISVIIPLYNKEVIVKRSIESVLSQDYEDFEVIVVNDGSTDKSAEIVRKIKDPRVRLIEQTNSGPSAARNTGIKNAKGDWLYFIDADDEIEQGTLLHFHELIQKFLEADMFLGEIYINDGKKKWLYCKYKDGFVKNIFKAHALGLTAQCSGSTIYRKEICLEYPYNEQIHRYEDLDCLFRKYRKASLYLTSRPVACINTNHSAASKGKNDISEDFVGHLNFKNKVFWERMSLYKLFIEERELYFEQIRKLYPCLFYRYDYFLFYKLLGWLKSYKPLWKCYLRISGFSQFIN